jgi:hypothetical protein
MGSLREAIKREMHFIKEGAKVAPRYAARAAKRAFEEKRQEAIEMRKMQAEAKKAERSAFMEEYKKARVARAKELGKRKGAKGQATGILGMMQELGAAGERLSSQNRSVLPQIAAPDLFGYGKGSQRLEIQTPDLLGFRKRPLKKRRK